MTGTLHPGTPKLHSLMAYLMAVLKLPRAGSVWRCGADKQSRVSACTSATWFNIPVHGTLAAFLSSTRENG